MIAKRTACMLILLLGLFSFAFADLVISAEVEGSAADGNKVNIVIMPNEASSIYIVQASFESGEWVTIRETRDLVFSTNISNDISTQFKVIALDENRTIVGEALSEKITTKAKWFNINRLNRFIALIVICGVILYFIGRARKNKKIYLRPVAGLQAFEEAVGRATEMGRSVLFVPGIMDLDQVETISGLIILGHVSKMTARYEADLNVPVSRSLVMESGRETVQASYISEGRPDLFSEDMVHYYTDDQFAFAAAVDGIMLREKPAAVFLQGKFYAESLIMAETGNSIGAIQIAGTGSPSQIPFFVTACDYTLIGEEFFAASAYLGDDPKLLGSIKGQDIVKAILMVVLGLGFLFETIFSGLYLSDGNNPIITSVGENPQKVYQIVSDITNTPVNEVETQFAAIGEDGIQIKINRDKITKQKEDEALSKLVKNGAKVKHYGWHFFKNSFKGS